MLIRPLTRDDFEAVDALWRRTDGVGYDGVVMFGKALADDTDDTGEAEPASGC